MRKHKKPSFRPFCDLQNPLKNRFFLHSLLLTGAFLLLPEKSKAEGSAENGNVGVQGTQAPSPDGETAEPIASFQGSMTGETETQPAPPSGINAPTFQGNPPTSSEEAKKAEVLGNGDDGASFASSSSPTYQHYFNQAPDSSQNRPSYASDPADPRNGPTYKKFFTPAEDRSPRIRKKRNAARGAGHEHLGATGHRRHVVKPVEQSSNAETTIGRATLEHFAEGTNALQALANSTPGASFNSSDASGLDAFANTFYLRGYNQTQLGFTMDGIPLGNQGYGGKAGADANQIIIQESIASLSASQGAGALDTPSSTLLGGTVTYTTTDPSDKLGVHISQQFGSFNGYRTYGRLDSGKLNHTGTKFYAAFLRNSQNLWTNSEYSQKEMDLLRPYSPNGRPGAPRGFNREEAVNFKFVQPISNFGKITVTSNWADQPEYGVADNNASMKKNLGYGDYNLAPDFGTANNLSAACKAKTASPDLCNLAYDYSEVQRVYLEGLKADFQISPSIKSSSVVYGQVTDSRSGSASNYYQTPNYVQGGGSNLAYTDSHTKARRVGVTQNFQFQLGHRNALKTGVWYENNRFNNPSFFYPLNSSTNTAGNDFTFTNGGGTQIFKQTFTANTFQFYVEDGFQMAKNMVFTYGFKSLVQTENGGTYGLADEQTLNNWGTSRSAYQTPYGRLTQSNAFLPHFNYDWKFSKKHEFYFDVAENMRPLDLGGSAWSTKTSQAAFDLEKKNLRGERTWNYVVGYRYDSKPFNFAIDYYHTDYIGRLGTVSEGNPNDQANFKSYLADLGNEKMDGMDLGLTSHLSHIFRIPNYLGTVDFMNSFSYNHAVYQGSVPGMPTAANPNPPSISIAGVQQVNYPRYMYKTDVHYSNGRLSWDLNVNYNSKTNVTYTGDYKNPGYWTSEFTGAVLLGPKSRKDQVKLAFSVSNLFGQHYTTQLTNLGAAVKGGQNTNLAWAAPREFFGSVNVAF